MGSRDVVTRDVACACVGEFALLVLGLWNFGICVCVLCGMQSMSMVFTGKLPRCNFIL